MERPDSKGTKQDWIDYAVALEGIQAEVLGDLTESEAEVAGLEAQLAADLCRLGVIGWEPGHEPSRFYLG